MSGGFGGDVVGMWWEREDLPVDAVHVGREGVLAVRLAFARVDNLLIGALDL